MNNQDLFVKDNVPRIDAKLKQILSFDTSAESLLEAIRYSCLARGKRIRPLLTLAVGLFNNASLDTLLTVGAAIELLHCYSLIHDDLPAMDNDDIRRGQLTCHKKYNEAIAILAGDALQPLAINILTADSLQLTPLVKLKIINLLTHSVGVNGMVGGQAIDLISTGIKLNLVQLRQMHELKTACLIKAAILSGYHCGKKFAQSTYTSLSQIADNLGLLFQIVDDILDVTENTENLGKTSNKDLLNDKATYVSILGLNQAQQLANQAYQEIQFVLTKLPGDISLLAGLIDLVYQRSK